MQNDMSNNNEVKVLVVEQHGKMESSMVEFIDWERMKRHYRDFDVIAKEFPESVSVVKQDSSPRWGHAFYRKGKDGKPELMSENWDTSG